jgi:hypothetical protein
VPPKVSLADELVAGRGEAARREEEEMGTEETAADPQGSR